MSEAGKEQILSETNQLPTSFEEMDLSKEVLRAIKDMGFTTPSTVQAKTIPLMMSGADVNAIAPTGTGKTCAFGIPMLEYVQLNEPEVQEVVLAPTRELALQIGDELTKLAKYIKGCRIAVLYGGQPIPKHPSRWQSRRSSRGRYPPENPGPVHRADIPSAAGRC